MRLRVNTVIHTSLVGLEPATFRSWVRRATSSATEPTDSQSLTAKTIAAGTRRSAVLPSRRRRLDDVIFGDIAPRPRDHFRFRRRVQLVDCRKSCGSSLTTTRDVVVRRTSGRQTGSHVTGSGFQRVTDAAVGTSDAVVRRRLPVT